MHSRLPQYLLLGILTFLQFSVFAETSDGLAADNLMEGWPREHSEGLPFSFPDPSLLKQSSASPEIADSTPDEYSGISLPALPVAHKPRLKASDLRLEKQSLVVTRGRSITSDASLSSLQIENRFEDVSVIIELEFTESEETLRLLLPPGENEQLVLEPGSVLARRESWRAGAGDPPLRQAFPEMTFQPGLQYAIELHEADEKAILRVIDAPRWGLR